MTSKRCQWSKYFPSESCALDVSRETELCQRHLEFLLERAKPQLQGDRQKFMVTLLWRLLWLSSGLVVRHWDEIVAAIKKLTVYGSPLGDASDEESEPGTESSGLEVEPKEPTFPPELATIPIPTSVLPLEESPFDKEWIDDPNERAPPDDGLRDMRLVLAGEDLWTYDQEEAAIGALAIKVAVALAKRENSGHGLSK